MVYPDKHKIPLKHSDLTSCRKPGSNTSVCLYRIPLPENNETRELLIMEAAEKPLNLYTPGYSYRSESIGSSCAALYAG